MSGKDETRTAFAPATVANVSVGFDVLGFAMPAVGDTVQVTRVVRPGIVVESITGVVTDLPTDPTRNTASVALQALLDRTGESHGFRVAVRKGLPLGSGMGGSAASAVAAVVAGNALLDAPLPREALLQAAAEGERAASGAAHADNAAPALFGGLVAVVSDEPLQVVPIPVPATLRAVLVHPHLRIDTREARAVLRTTIGLEEHVGQSMRLAGLISGCFHEDVGLIGRSLQDRIVEPQRSRLIPGFDDAAAAARDAGALGFGIAGSGPSVFAWVEDDERAERVRQAVEKIFRERGIDSDGYVHPLRAEGARIVSS